jgi:hypothetical protein
MGAFWGGFAAGARLGITRGELPSESEESTRRRAGRGAVDESTTGEKLPGVRGRGGPVDCDMVVVQRNNA